LLEKSGELPRDTRLNPWPTYCLNRKKLDVEAVRFGFVHWPSISVKSTAEGDTPQVRGRKSTPRVQYIPALNGDRFPTPFYDLWFVCASLPFHLPPAVLGRAHRLSAIVYFEIPVAGFHQLGRLIESTSSRLMENQ